MLMIRDLSTEYQLETVADRHPFDFCAKTELSSREVKLCAEYWLAAVRTNGHGAGPSVKSLKGKVALWGFPKLAAYNRCMMTATMFQMKACIREVTRGIDNVNLMAPDMLQLGKTGKLPNKETERLDKIAMHAITTAEPEAAVEGVNGGANGKMAEYTSKDFMESFNDAGMPPKTNGCENMGMAGCEPAREGGVKPPEAHRALTEIQAIDIIRKMYEGKIKKMPALNFNDFDADGDGKIDMSEFEGKLRYMGWSEKEIEQAFKDIDANKDHKLSSEEFVNFKRSLQGVVRAVKGVGDKV